MSTQVALPPDPRPTFRATYLIETAHDPRHAAEVIAGEQSSGTFLRIEGETDELKARARAQVEAVEVIGEVERPTLSGATAPAGGRPRFRRAQIRIAWPFDNVGPSLPNLVATVMGNLYELQEFSGLRLLDLDLPVEFARPYQGPRYGVEGTRRLAGVHDRPIIGTIVKPSVGLSPEATGELVARLCEAGLDFIKDDELMANPPHSPFADRVSAVMKAIDRHAQRTGRKVMYAFNLTDEPEAMKRHHDVLVAHGATCAMLSLNSVGLGTAAEFRRHCALPIHGHRNGWGMLTRCDALGVEFTAYQKLWRIAGVDHLHVSGLENKFWEPDESVVRAARACLTPFPDPWPAWTTMPIFSSAQWAGQAPATYERLGSAELVYLCGGGIFGHPGGIAAGVRSVRQGWEAALARVPLETYARDHRELREALDFFGRRGARASGGPAKT
jgi:ribulose-bisphosphate carboxylase large chain